MKRILTLLMMAAVTGCADRAQPITGSEAALSTQTHTMTVQARSTASSAKEKNRQVARELEQLIERYYQQAPNTSRTAVTWYVAYGKELSSAAHSAQKTLTHYQATAQLEERATLQGKVTLTVVTQTLHLPECPAYGFKQTARISGCFVENNRVIQTRHLDALIPAAKEVF